MVATGPTHTTWLVRRSTGETITTATHPQADIQQLLLQGDLEIHTSYGTVRRLLRPRLISRSI